MSAPVTAGGGRAPERIGRYEVRALLGTGGFANVYEAYDAALDATVAVKVLEPTPTMPAIARERFLAEAQLLRRVDDPHVVTVYDIGELDDGRPYFVMEFADAGVLSRRIPAQPGLADAASLRAVINGLGSAMRALHDVGVVHRDLKPENLFVAGVTTDQRATRTGSGILRDGERVLVGDLGIAKDKVRENAEPTILGGTPSFRAPEQMTLGAEITPATDVYGATGVIWNLLTGSAPPEPNALDVQLGSVPSEWRSVLRRGLDPDPAQRFATADEWATACLAAIGDVDPETSIGFRAALTSDVCPYKGLAAFQPDDAALFFGREKLIDDLVRRLQSSSALIVGGPSGSGKSSLVRAGLLPALESGVVPGAQHWKVALFTPGTGALSELAFHLARLSGDDSITAERLAGDPDGVRRIVAAGPSVLLAIDQFEELFTLNQPDVQTAFVAALSTLTTGSHPNVRVVIAVRADFYDSCARHEWLAERINENQVLVGPMGSAELRRAIEGPAQQTGLQIEPGLVDMILDDAGASSGSLPLLAHALMETWIRRRGHQLTIAGYRAAGGVAGAISQRAEDTYANLSASDQERARDLVLQMTSPGENGPDTRRLLAWSEIADYDANLPVVETFVDARLVTTTDEYIELAHETLLRSWPRASQWIDEARDGLRTRQRVAQAAHEWTDADHDPDLLLRGTPLESTLDWASQQRGQLAVTSQEFLDASRDARDAQLAAEAQEASRRRRNRRIAFAALAILLVAAVVQSINARRNETMANESSEAARRQANQSLAASAEAQAATDPLLALALAGESAARDDIPGPVALGALSSARVALAEQVDAPVPLSDAIPVGNVLHLDLTEDGSLLVLGGRSGEVTFWDVATRTIIQTDTTHTKGVESVSIHDQMAITGGADGQILLWDLTQQPYTPEVLDTIEGWAVWSAEISPDGRRASAVTSDAGVTFYDLPARAKLGTRFDSALDRDALRSVFTPDGSELLVGNSQGELIRIDVEAATPDVVLKPHATNIWDIEQSADGRFVYSASNDGTVRRVDLSTMEVDENFLLGMADSVVEMRGIEGLANGRDVIMGDVDGHILRWSAETGELIARSAAAHEDRVIDGAASADGRLYVSLSDDQTIRLWDLASRTRPIGRAVDELPPAAFGLSLGPDGMYAAGGEDGQVVIGGNGREQTIGVGDGPVFALDFTPSGSLVVGGADGRVTLWDATTGSLIAEASEAHSARVMDVVVSPSGDRIASAGAGGDIRIWDATSLERTGAVDSLATEVNGLTYSPDGVLVSVDLRGDVRFWNEDGSEQRSAIAAGEDALFAATIDPTGTRLVVAGGDEALAVFDLETGTKLHRLTPMIRGAIDIAHVTPQVVAGLSKSGSVGIWDIVTGEQLGPIHRVHPDGDARSLAVDDSLGIWTTAGGGVLYRLGVLDRSVACEASAGVFDLRRQEKFLAEDETLASCT